uniref:LIM and SH3 domain protein 1 n=1 Tax=Meleagris gallopavo TaxID=9103 RepID=G1N0V8_MELGA
MRAQSRARRQQWKQMLRSSKFWHKACFHCETCKMTLNMKNYKGYEKKPYCNAFATRRSLRRTRGKASAWWLTPRSCSESKRLRIRSATSNTMKSLRGAGWAPAPARAQRWSAGTPRKAPITDGRSSTNHSTTSSPVTRFTSSSHQPRSPMATRSLQRPPPRSAVHRPQRGSVSVPSMITTRPMKTRSPSRMVTPSSTCSRSTTVGCTARWNARATRACCPPTTWKQSEGVGAKPPHPVAPVRARLSPPASLPSAGAASRRLGFFVFLQPPLVSLANVALFSLCRD